MASRCPSSSAEPTPTTSSCGRPPFDARVMMHPGSVEPPLCADAGYKGLLSR
jgi:hypothetical protein